MSQNPGHKLSAKDEVENSDLLRNVIDNLPDYVYVKDTKGRYILNNLSHVKALGASSPEEVAGKSDFDFYPKELAERYRIDEQEIISSGRPLISREEPRVNEAGNRIWHSTTKVPIRGDGGRVIGLLGVTQDVTERKQAEEALEESEERFRTAFEDAPIGMALVGLDRCRFKANRALCEMLGYSEEELLGKDYLEHVHPEDREISVEHRRRALEGGPQSYTLERRYIHADGHVVWNLTSVSLIRDSKGEPSHLVCLHQDITERKRAEEKLRQSEKRFRSLTQNASDIITLLEVDGTIKYESPSIERILGYHPDELVGKNAFGYVHPDDLWRVLSAFAEGLANPELHPSIEYRFRHKDGSWRYLESIGSNLLDDPEVEELVVNSRDVTERRELEKQLRHQAFHDSLTELPNRALFLDRLKHALTRTRREGGPIAVLFLDLNDFKVINDSLGHDAGNAVLVGVAERLQGSVRPGDTVGRIFGDEFAVLLEAPAGVEEARRVTERIQEALQVSFDIDGHEVFVSPSVGIAFGETGKVRSEEVLRRADLAMYTAKRHGRAQYEMYSPSMNVRTMERMNLERNLRRAIEREEFEVHYQPVIELSSGKIDGFEALARWRHPERGLVTVEEFIQIAEETGLIHPIGQWVLGEAYRQAQEWRELYPNKMPLMSVNLSASQFSRQPDLIPKVLNDTGLDPGALQLEITERAVMNDAEFSLGKLQMLKGLGIGFAIDDYGMGYSCLYYLKRMPVDSLKIDRSFIAGLGEDPGDQAIVSGTISLAHALGLKVVAKGVEREEQLATLKELGCDLAQGYHFTKPLPGEAAERLLKEGGSW